MVSFLLCLLPALLATSAQGTLKCEKCYGSADTCQPAKETCTAAKATGGCISGAGKSTLGSTVLTGLGVLKWRSSCRRSLFSGLVRQPGVRLELCVPWLCETPTTVFYKECTDDYNSGIKSPITFTGGNGTYLRINTTRCNDIDNCNSAVLDVPKGSATKNGLQCPTCFDLKSDTCNGTITTCTGDETYCIDFIGKILNGPSSSPFAAKGCATASAQDIKPGTFLVSGPYIYLFSRATYALAEKIPAPSGASQALGKFSFALYLPGLTGLLLVKLLS
ncbi:phospholipase A2 inhibitor and Ly6/PLAUR domain-containing protein-like [Dermochelys coriacea]|uniref:phospholipase A2 inhibitor and Ly6/PLAUR domain-containing protein-like n=1 Tax=Dermochelys coriacea TaxID=27794 RepID=UPI001CA89F3D|nr:phospholipase A2 inhibitor and Ly6/PLAUR domain-containing protein-like [Dermochelys coriacea]